MLNETDSSPRSGPFSQPTSETIDPQLCQSFDSEKEYTLKGKNLVLFPFRVDPFLIGILCARKQTGSHKINSLVKCNGKQL